MDDDNTIIENYDTSDEVDFSEELRKSTLPNNVGQWLWIFGVVIVFLAIAAALMFKSWFVFICGFCFSAIFFGLDAVIIKLDEVLFELRRK